MIVILCTGFLWASCANPFDRNRQLQQACNTVDSDPQGTLRMLETANRQHLDKDERMQYVVLLTQARYMNYQDITGDSLILEAQRYFANSPNADMAARASYYAASFWDEKGDEGKGLEYSLLAYYFAQRAGNNLFMAKSAQWTGSVYYNQDLLDSARVCYQKALELYDKESNAEAYKLGLRYMLGRTYRELGQFDQALVYFNNGLELARKLHDTEYEALLLYKKGRVLSDKKEYKQAKEYFNQALSMNPNAEDSLRIYLSYARLYKATDQPDSTIYYLDQVKSNIAKITYPYTRKAVYQELASYYKNEANNREMEYFLKLANKEDQQIKELKNEKGILLINRLFEQFLKFEWFKQKAEQKYSETLKIGLIIVIVLAFLLIVFRFDKRKLKEKYQELRYQNLFQKMDWQNSLIGSLKGVSKSVDAICMNNQPITAELVRKQLLPLRVKFSMEFADLTREGLAQFPNGNKALHQLDSEDLCLIHLKKLNHTDESISWMLGYEQYSKFYIDSRKREIRRILVKAGMKENDIQTIFPW